MSRDGHTHAIARSLDQLAGLYPMWDRFQVQRVDADPEFFSTFVRLSPHVVRPHVALLGDVDTPLGIVVARIEDVTLESTVGYKVIHRPTVRRLTIAHGGIAGGDRSGAELAVTEIQRALDAGEAEAALLPALRTDSDLFESVKSVGWLRRGHGIRPAVHHRLTLPAAFEDFLGELRNRKRLESYRRRLERDFGDRLALRVYSRPSDLEVVIRDMSAVAAKTYQLGLGVAFRDDVVHRELTRLGLERGWFRAWVLYLDENPISFWPGDIYARTFYTGTPGYDPAFASHRVGLLLLLRVIEDLCGAPEVDAVDFNFGDADYKRRFANESWEEIDVLLFAPTLRATRINLVHSGLLASASVGRRVLSRVGLDTKLKRWWRGRLSGDPSPSTDG